MGVEQEIPSFDGFGHDEDRGSYKAEDREVQIAIFHCGDLQELHEITSGGGCASPILDVRRQYIDRDNRVSITASAQH